MAKMIMPMFKGFSDINNINEKIDNTDEEELYTYISHIQQNIEWILKGNESNKKQ